MDDRRNPMARWSWAAIVTGLVAHEARRSRPDAARRPARPGLHPPRRLHRMFHHTAHTVQDNFIGYPETFVEPPLGYLHQRQFAVQVAKADPHRFTLYQTDFLPDTDQFSPIGASRFNMMYVAAARLVRADHRRVDPRPAGAGRVAPPGDPGDARGGRAADAGRAGPDRAVALSGGHGCRGGQQLQQHDRPQPDRGRRPSRCRRPSRPRPWGSARMFTDLRGSAAFPRGARGDPASPAGCGPDGRGPVRRLRPCAAAGGRAGDRIRRRPHRRPRRSKDSTPTVSVDLNRTVGEDTTFHKTATDRQRFQVHIDFGKVFEAQGNLDRAVQEYQDALKVAETRGRGHSQRGRRSPGPSPDRLDARPAGAVRPVRGPLPEGPEAQPRRTRRSGTTRATAIISRGDGPRPSGHSGRR